MTILREVFATIADWLREGRRFAAATLVAEDRAGPAPLGTTLAVDARGAIAGNIGAGCYESDIIEACLQTIGDGRARTVDIAIEEEVFGGTGCGASLHIVTWIPSPAFAEDADAIAQGERPVQVEIPLFTFTVDARSPLILVGATDLAEEIAHFARRLDYRPIVVDPRPVFATHQRLPSAYDVVQGWPDDVLPALLTDDPPVIVVSHDRKVDVPTLECALRSGSPYIALLGSRRAQHARRDTLRNRGFRDDELDRIHGPAGLDLGGSSTAETALSILAELIAVRNKRTGASLRGLAGPIQNRGVVLRMNPTYASASLA